MTLKERLHKLARQMQPVINDALAHEVADTVRDTEINAILDNVYGVYSPVIYDRRGAFGGMADPANIEHRVDDDGTLHVWNATPANPGGTLDNSRVTSGKYLADLVEHGHNCGRGKYDFPSRGAYMKPRQFTAITVEKIKSSGEIKAALKAGLKRLGFKTI